MKESQIAVMEEFIDNVRILISKEKRSKANIVESILREDILFSSPSGAAMFVVGKSANGLTSWKNADGITLKDIESDETK